MGEVNLQLKKDYLPINLSSPEDESVVKSFRFYYDDESVRDYNKNAEKHRARIDKIDLSKKDESVKNDLILKEGYEFFLGKGAYNDIKELQKSQFNRRVLFLELVKLMEKAINDMQVAQDEKEAEFYVVEK